MKNFHLIVELKYDEAAPLITQYQDGEEKAVLEHLKQWDYGIENEHSPTEEPPAPIQGTARWHGKYLIVVDRMFDTIALYRRTGRTRRS